ncbi:MAG: PIN domain-containing protein [Chitinispirillaceae bacterium]|nr:PIN domain-containing protein [Chitinispirillaceae bacterium]
MILVDTSVWIDYFAGNRTAGVSILKSAIADSEDLGICGVVFTEVLQGIRTDEEFDRVQMILDDLIYLPQEKSTHFLAATISRAMGKKGKTIRKPIDCIIAALCIENSIFLLHNDRDFDFIAGKFPLQCYGGK